MSGMQLESRLGIVLAPYLKASVNKVQYPNVDLASFWKGGDAPQEGLIALLHRSDIYAFCFIARQVTEGIKMGTEDGGVLEGILVGGNVLLVQSERTKIHGQQWIRTDELNDLLAGVQLLCQEGSAI